MKNSGQGYRDRWFLGKKISQSQQGIHTPLDLRTSRSFSKSSLWSPDKANNDFSKGRIEWFTDGELNASGSFSFFLISDKSSNQPMKTIQSKLCRSSFGDEERSNCIYMGRRWSWSRGKSNLRRISQSCLQTFQRLIVRRVFKLMLSSHWQAQSLLWQRPFLIGSVWNPDKLTLEQVMQW